VSGARRESLGSASTPICDEEAVSDARLRLIDDGNHLDFDELLRLAKLKHGDVGRGRLVIERRKIGVSSIFEDQRARPAAPILRDRQV
jgi:hypothetical protein